MELYRQLQERADAGKAIRVGLVGCGQMGAGFMHVTNHMTGMETCVIADINVNRPLAELKTLGIADSAVRVTNQSGEAEDALAHGKYVVTEDALLLPKLQGIDAVVEATGMTSVGAAVASTCIDHRKHIVMINMETDVTVGFILSRLAQKAGCVYTAADGDEPAICMMLYDFARSLGFEVVTLGKGKNNTLDLEATPESCRELAELRGQSPKVLASFMDGTKTMVEMAAVSNATGLIPDLPGMHGPKVELDEVVHVFVPQQDGGILSRRGCVDYSTGKIAPGVFAIVTHPDKHIRSDMHLTFSMGPGPYFLFLRPFHLCNIETPLAVARAVLHGEPTVIPQTMVSEVVAMAKRDLHTGQIVDDIGGPDFFGRIYTYADARSLSAIPIGVAPRGQVLSNIGKGEPLTARNFRPDPTSFIYRLRESQDALLNVGQQPILAGGHIQ
jgi:predicted homoserine dehydrogenase-like protein